MRALPWTELYPPLEPYDTGMLEVGSGHSLYYEQCGNPDGVPCVFLHGGPGAGCDERSRRFFDPQHYRIVCFDQRGSGRSVPNAADDLAASLIDNTTPDLVQAHATGQHRRPLGKHRRQWHRCAPRFLVTP